MTNSTPAPPRAAQKPRTAAVHGETLSDPWHWLRAPNWNEVLDDPQKLPPEIRSLLEAENRYCEAVLKPAAAAREKLREDLKARIAPEEESAKLPRAPWTYWTRWQKNKQYKQHWRAPVSEPAAEELLLDEAVLAENKGYFRLLGLEISPDQNLLAYAADTQGSEVGTLAIRSLDNNGGAVSEVRAGQCNGDFIWNAAGDGLYYIRLDAHHRPSEVWFHSLGGGGDALVHRETDGGFFLGLESHSESRALLLHAHDHSVSEVRRLPDAGGAPRDPPLLARDEGARARAAYDARRRRFLMLRGDPDCLDGRLEIIAEDGGAREVVIAHRAGRTLKDITLTADLALVAVNDGGKPGLLLLNLETHRVCEIETPEAIGDLALVDTLEYRRNRLYFMFSSPRTPPALFALEDGKTETLWRKPAPGHDSEKYVVESLAFASHDGAEVPCTLLRRRDLHAPGSPRPTLLYGYGAYGIDEPGRFSPARLALVDAGVQFAAARPRGGSDLGRGWYEDGKLARKENTFHDCIAVAEGLIAAGRATSECLALAGGSAGGMMVGAVLNRAAGRFRAALAMVPFVDVLNTMLDDSLPLTPPEWREWGDPITDPAAFRRMRGYSPCENVADLEYPWILATAGVSDPRVGYWEPAKWVQRLRAFSSRARGPILLETNMGAGHGGASGRYDRLDETARDWAFLLLALGLLDARP